MLNQKYVSLINSMTIIIWYICTLSEYHHKQHTKLYEQEELLTLETFNRGAVGLEDSINICCNFPKTSFHFLAHST